MTDSDELLMVLVDTKNDVCISKRYEVLPRQQLQGSQDHAGKETDSRVPGDHCQRLISVSPMSPAISMTGASVDV